VSVTNLLKDGEPCYLHHLKMWLPRLHRRICFQSPFQHRIRYIFYFHLYCLHIYRSGAFINLSYTEYLGGILVDRCMEIALGAFGQLDGVVH